MRMRGSMYLALSLSLSLSLSSCVSIYTCIGFVLSLSDEEGEGYEGLYTKFGGMFVLMQKVRMLMR